MISEAEECGRGWKCAGRGKGDGMGGRVSKGIMVGLGKEERGMAKGKGRSWSGV